MKTSQQQDVAIIGMAGVFPKAPDVGAFWRNILAAVDAIGEPVDWSPEFRCEEGSTENDRVYTRRGGYLGDLARFDPLAYGVMPRSIDGGEPEHFIALRLAQDALADAGYAERPFDRERTGVVLGRGTFVNRGFIGVLQHGMVVDQTLRILSRLHPEYGPAELAAIRTDLKAQLPPFNAETAPSLAHSVMCGRIANRLDLRGPAYTVDAACASSLIAVQQAIGELTSGRCELMLAGGVQTSTNFPIALIFCQLGALSRTGRLRPFHPDADGTLLGEAAGILVLKRRRDAERDGDRVYAVLKGIGLASDGRAVGLLAPRVEGEELAMRRAYELTGIAPQSIGLLEAHGTGTPVGDATELDALERVFGTRDAAPPSCALGSVKSMIGHCIPAAGAASLIKTALALHHRVLPPTLHADVPNPRLARLPFYLNPTPRPWIHAGPEPRRAAVSAFGFGGIDAHAILEEYVPPSGAPHGQRLDTHWPAELIVVSASAPAGLAERCTALVRFLEANPAVSLADVAATLNLGIEPGAARVAFVATDVRDLTEKLTRAAARLASAECERIRDRAGIYYVRTPLEGGVAFLFPGEGAQHPNMLRDLCLRFSEVRAVFDLMDRAFREHARGILPSQTIFPMSSGDDPERERLWHIDGAIEAVFTANQALFALLTRLGIRPAAMLGHSSGEYSALLASGAAPLDSDDELIDYVLAGNRVTERAVRDALVPTGVLVAVGPASAPVVREVLAANRDVYLAMDNCPNQVVLFGASEAMAEAEATLRAGGTICQRLPFGRAYHTPLFAPVAQGLGEFFAGVRFAPPVTPLYSCVTAAPMGDDPATIRRLAVAQWTHPVRFRETIEAMHEAGIRIFIEVGPRGNLTTFVEDVLRGRPHLAVAADSERRSSIVQLCHLLAALTAHAVPMTLDTLYVERGARRLPLDALTSGAALETPADRTVRLETALPVVVLRSDVVPARPLAAPVIPAGRAEFPAAIAPAAAAGTPHDGGVMQEYLNTMEVFLATQRDVMASFLGRDAPPLVAAPPPMPARIPALEPPTLPPATPPPPPVVEVAPPRAADADALRALLIELVSETTGYPPDMLDPSLDLEADLGIDSIKRVEILGALDRRTGLIGQAMEQATRLRTLEQILHFLARTDAAPVATNGQAHEPPPPVLASGSPPWAFGGTEVRQDGEPAALTLRVTITPDEAPFLYDHTLGGTISDDTALRALPVLPLTMSVELIAEAASRLLPGRVVTAVRRVRAHRWIDFRMPRVDLEARARITGPTTVDVALFVLATPAAATLAVEASVELASTHVPASGPDWQPVRDPGPSQWTPAQLYAEGLRHGMFHGPSLQGVVAIDAIGTDGAEGTLRALPTAGLFRDEPQPRFALDAVLLDSASQVLGYWTAERLERGFVVFPGGVESVTLHAPPLSPPATARCRLRVRDLDARRIRVDFDVLAEDGRPLASVRGWEVVRIDLPDAFYAFRLAPHEVLLAEPVPDEIPVPDHAVCRRVHLPAALLEADGGVWREALAHLVLGATERAEWRSMKAGEKRRTEWLLGRVAAKDAVRSLLHVRAGVSVFPADVCIENDAHGAPRASGSWTTHLDAAPAISLAHAGGAAIALAADGRDGGGVGIDIEPFAVANGDFETAAFSADERAVLDAVPASQRDEWLRRAWCAKEALAKALGRGLLGGPYDVRIRALDLARTRVLASLASALARQFPQLTDHEFSIVTARFDDTVVAVASLADSKLIEGETHDLTDRA